MPAVFEYLLQVLPAQIDGWGHVNNVEYVRWMQDAAIAHSSSLGWSADRYREADCGFVARAHRIDYLQPAWLGDEIVVRTWVASMEKITSVRRYSIIRVSDGQLLATAETTWALVSLSTGRPTRIPPHIRADFESAILPENEKSA